MGIREDILVLGLTAGVMGALVGGLMLALGLGMVTQGAHAGWVLVIPAAPLAGWIGKILAKKLVKRLDAEKRI
ncbi:hypothetical protein [Roseomonas indoligenes]|uniref:Uncharacterized protein n=1 Tax=Roseomonas indoligenes TaxID=2820811 RepID=A0A940N034_9PROT|nr:hypothetical protein [Pararoseomonas indoligenes]MBP0493621.1 hypothetical protein [Pararoseomonas indoligenes]